MARLTSLREMWSELFPVGGIFVFLLALFPVGCKQNPNPPVDFVISTCGPVLPGRLQIHGATSKLQFEAQQLDFSLTKAERDMPPGELFTVAPKNRKGRLQIAFSGDLSFEEQLASGFPIYSRQIGSRQIRKSDGQPLGEDRWGYLQTGERWRYLKFSTGDRAGYLPTTPGNADILDLVIASGCMSRN